MTRAYRHLIVEVRDGVYRVNFRNRRLDEVELADLTDELLGLIDDGCRLLALSFGPEPPLFLYSVFLARLVTLQRMLREQSGSLILCDLKPEVLRIFEACRLDLQFRFARDLDEATTLLLQSVAPASK
jgi:hypothetical protein